MGQVFITENLLKNSIDVYQGIDLESMNKSQPILSVLNNIILTRTGVSCKFAAFAEGKLCLAM